MTRYFYEPAYRNVFDGEVSFEYKEEIVFGYNVYDSKKGREREKAIAFCHDTHSAETIIDALNAYEESRRVAS